MKGTISRTIATHRQRSPDPRSDVLKIEANQKSIRLAFERVPRQRLPILSWVLVSVPTSPLFKEVNVLVWMHADMDHQIDIQDFIGNRARLVDRSLAAPKFWD